MVLWFLVGFAVFGIVFGMLIDLAMKSYGHRRREEERRQKWKSD